MYKTYDEVMELFFDKEISELTYKIYLLMRRRMIASMANEVIDENENFYVKLSYLEIRDRLQCGFSKISSSIKQLVALNIISKKTPVNGGSSHYYLELPQTVEISTTKKAPKKEDVSPKEAEIVKFLKQEEISDMTINNILKFKGISLEKIKNILGYIKEKGYTEGALVVALKENWNIAKTSKKKEKAKISPEELEIKRKWVNYFAGLSKPEKEEALELVTTIPIKVLNQEKSRLGQMNTFGFINSLRSLRRRNYSNTVN